MTAGAIILLAFGLTVIVSLLLARISPLTLDWFYLLASLVAGVILLLKPAYELYKQKEGRLAAKLFDNASYYPLAQLAIIAVFVLLK